MKETPIQELNRQIDLKIESIDKEYYDGKFKSSLISKWLLFKSTISFLDLEEKEKKMIIDTYTAHVSEGFLTGEKHYKEHYES